MLHIQLWLQYRVQELWYPWRSWRMTSVDSALPVRMDVLRRVRWMGELEPFCKEKTVHREERKGQKARLGYRYDVSRESLTFQANSTSTGNGSLPACLPCVARFPC